MLTGESFQKAQNLRVFYAQLDKAQVSVTRPWAPSQKVTKLRCVANNILCPCIHEADAFLELESYNIFQQRLHLVYEQRLSRNNGGRCIPYFAGHYRFRRLDTHAVTMHDMAHRKSLFGPRKIAFLLENLNSFAAMAPVHNNQDTRSWRPSDLPPPQTLKY